MSSNEQKKCWTRWACVGPYYAMFPSHHVLNVIEQYSKSGDAILDPFAGRFSVTAVASYLGRIGIGIEINPLGYLYGIVKLNPAHRCGDVIRRLHNIRQISGRYSRKASNMDEFFHICYCPAVLRFLLACRKQLNWRTSPVDATLMAQILISLHHEKGRGLSNQMRQVKSMAPKYSIRWWKKNGFKSPPEIDPEAFLQQRIEWRYKHGTPRDADSMAYWKDSSSFLDNLPSPNNRSGKFNLLFTSPPYYNLVNYHKDQWLRLWMLGGEPYPQEGEHKHKKRFSNKDVYESLLQTTFEKCAIKMAEDATIIVRTDTRKYTRDITEAILRKCFPSHEIKGHTSRILKSQSILFNNANLQEGKERDLILLPC